MTQPRAVLTLLCAVALASSVYGQDPDPELKRACSKYKRDIYEERVEYGILFSNAPVQYKVIDSCPVTRRLIVGGMPADPKEFPHMARLGHRNKDNETAWFCGGTLINSRLVLTAAHCFFSPTGEINVVRLGELVFDSQTDDADPEDFGVRQLIEYPKFEYPKLYHDIAIVQLDRPVTFNVYKHPACLPFTNGSSILNFIAIGWGHTRFAGRPSKHLLKVQLDNFDDRCLTNTDLDEELPNGYDVNTMLCVGSAQTKNTCNGDSGGPLLSYHAEFPCMYHVMGITSVGVSCEQPNQSTVYTRVHHYLGWIKEMMAKHV